MEQGPDELSERTMESVNAEAPGPEGAGTEPEADRSSPRSGQSQEPDPVDEGSEESFPASDPPSETNPAL